MINENEKKKLEDELKNDELGRPSRRAALMQLVDDYCERNKEKTQTENIKYIIQYYGLNLAFKTIAKDYGSYKKDKANHLKLLYDNQSISKTLGNGTKPCVESIEPAEIYEDEFVPTECVIVYNPQFDILKLSKINIKKLNTILKPVIDDNMGLINEIRLSISFGTTHKNNTKIREIQIYNRNK